MTTNQRYIIIIVFSNFSVKKSLVEILTLKRELSSLHPERQCTYRRVKHSTTGRQPPHFWASAPPSAVSLLSSIRRNSLTRQHAGPALCRSSGVFLFLHGVRFATEFFVVLRASSSILSFIGTSAGLSLPKFFGDFGRVRLYLRPPSGGWLKIL